MKIICNSNFSVNKDSFLGSQPYLLIYISSMAAFKLQWQRREVLIENYGPQHLRYLQSDHLHKRSANLCFR